MQLSLRRPLAAVPASTQRQQVQQRQARAPCTAAAVASRPLRPFAPCARRSARTAVVQAAGRYEAPSSAAGPVVIEVLADEAAVAKHLCDAVEAAAKAAIAERGIFTLAIPGGSVLKALAGLAGRTAIPWDKVKIFFVNHKTVPSEDAATSSYAKARAIFLDAVGAPPGCVATLSGSDDAEAEAAAYTVALSDAADASGMERAPSGAPRFDLLLLGVGADGHVGSLYPGGTATLAGPTAAWVLPVVKSKPPASVTLSLGVMNAARSVLVCLTGASKAIAAKLALETSVPAGEFPAQMVQPNLAPAVWLLDEAAAADLAVVQGSKVKRPAAVTGAPRPAATSKAASKAEPAADNKADAPAASKAKRASAASKADPAVASKDKTPAAASKAKRPSAASKAAAAAAKAGPAEASKPARPTAASKAAAAAASEDGSPAVASKPKRPAAASKAAAAASEAEPAVSNEAAPDAASKADPAAGQLLPDGSIMYTF